MMTTVKRVTLISQKSPISFLQMRTFPIRPCLQASDIKTYHFSARYFSKDQPPSQALSLSGYYADLLSSPITKQSPNSTATLDNVTRTERTKEDRARVVFGSRLAGSGYERRSSDTPDATWRTINGVPVPPRPAEPDNCCMSGCAHCVWDDYRDEVESWAVRLREAQFKGRGGGGSSGPGIDVKVGIHRSEVTEASISMDDDGCGSETNRDRVGTSDLFSTIPVGIREFMRTEKRLRDRRRHEK